MARVISIANSKGGVGKSTVTMLLAAAIAKEQGKKILILDTDSQQSVVSWMEAERSLDDKDPLVEAYSLQPQHVQMHLTKFGEDYDLIFIDIPRMTNSMNESANVQLLYYCDSILIPVVGSRLDVMSTENFYKVVKEAEATKKELGFDYRILGFMNKQNNRKDHQTAKQVLEEQLGIPMLDTSLRDLSIFTAPSLFESILDTREGKIRFEPFYNEVISKLEIK